RGVVTHLAVVQDQPAGVVEDAAPGTVVERADSLAGKLSGRECEPGGAVGRGWGNPATRQTARAARKSPSVTSATLLLVKTISDRRIGAGKGGACLTANDSADRPILLVWDIYLTGVPQLRGLFWEGADLAELNRRPGPMTLSDLDCSAYVNSPVC